MSLFSRAPKPPIPLIPSLHQAHSQPTRLELFTSFSSGLPADEAIMKTTAAGVVMASNASLSKALDGSSKEWETTREAIIFPCWSGTMTAYVEPGKTFRESSERIASIDNAHYIVYTDLQTDQRWLFRIPEDYLDKRDSILVVEHPNFQLISEGNDRIVCAAFVDLVEKFPVANGWHKGDTKYDIPHGPTNSYPARYLRRIEKRVGLAARVHGDYFRRQLVGLFDQPSYRLGVVVQHPAPVFDPDAPNHYRKPVRLFGPDGKPIASDGESETRNPRAMTKQGFGLFARAGEMVARVLGLGREE